MNHFFFFFKYFYTLCNFYMKDTLIDNFNLILDYVFINVANFEFEFPGWCLEPEI